jgi:hypothetical protein
MELIIIGCLIILFIFLLIYFQLQDVVIENFEEKPTKLLIKKTKNYDKVFENSKYTIWIPKPINEYYPIGNYITFNNKPPKFMAILVKNNSGIDSSDKPIKYEISSITNNNYAIWKPIADDKHKALGHIYSKEYPSKYLIRTVPKQFCVKSNITNKIIKNSISKIDKGYELWSIQGSNLFTCNNLNNYNLNNIKNIYKLKESHLDIEKKMYIKTINSYKKMCSFEDKELNKSFYVWRPITTDNFCSLGDIILSKDLDPNGKHESIVVHKSFCKIPLNYGTKSIYTIKTKDKNITFWRPKPHNDYYFFGDIVVIGDEQPEADNLIYSISVDFIKQVEKATHTMIYNNISENNPLSIWSDSNNLFTINNSYNSPIKDKYVLNMNFTESDLDLNDSRKIINISYKKNNNFKNISKKELLELIKKSIANKIDVRVKRLNDISFNKNNIQLNIEPKSASLKEPNINKCLDKLNKYLELEPLKIYNKNKDVYYISLFKIYKTKDDNIIELDNSQYNTKLE